MSLQERWTSGGGLARSYIAGETDMNERVRWSSPLVLQHGCLLGR